MGEQIKTKTDVDEHLKLESNVTCEDQTISKLNDDCLNLIFNFLSVEDRMKIEKVCKKWQQVSKISWINVKTLKVDPYLLKNTYEKEPGIWVFPSLNHVLSLCGNYLNHVKLPSYSDRFLDVLNLLKTSCPNLNSLDFNNTTITYHEAEFLIRNFNNLIDITMANYWPSSEKMLIEFFSKNKQLRSIKINFSERVSGNFLPALSETIESLFIRNCKHFDTSNIVKALQKLSKLRTLSLCGGLSFIENVDSILQGLPANSNLTDLILEFTGHQRTKKTVLIKHFANLTNLRELQIGGSMMLNSNNLHVISNHCKKLSKVWLLECEYLWTEDFENFVGALNLDELHIYHSRLDDISYMSSLKALTFHYCYNLYNDNFHEVLQSQNLKKMNVMHCDDVNGEALIENALESRTSNEFLELIFQKDSNDMCKVRIAASRLYIIKNDLNLSVKEKLTL